MKPNRDAFHALLLVSTLFALFLVVLGIAAWNTRIAFLPLTPKPSPSASLFRRPVPIGEVGAGFPHFTRASNTAAVTAHAAGLRSFQLSAFSSQLSAFSFPSFGVVVVLRTKPPAPAKFSGAGAISNVEITNRSRIDPVPFPARFLISTSPVQDRFLISTLEFSA